MKGKRLRRSRSGQISYISEVTEKREFTSAKAYKETVILVIPIEDLNNGRHRLTA